jgi:hypothetical protein
MTLDNADPNPMISPRAGLTQLVECQLPKLNVAGSSPVSRSLHSAHILARR